MKFLPFFLKGLIIVSLFFISSSVSAQSLYPPKSQSPNAASLGSFGETPVNLFTGTPDISIPIYNLSYGKMSVPITLRYNQGSVKPAQQPGWVGSGWDLQCGGAITRQKHGKVDEWYVNNYSSGQSYDAFAIKAYYPFPAGSPGNPNGTSNFGSYYANIPYSWGSTSQLATDFYVNTFNDPIAGNIMSSPAMDPEADEFSFNVLGHSGKFYYEGAAGWKVISDEDIKVEMLDFFTPIEVVAGIDEHVNASAYQGCLHPTPNNSYQSRMFGSFRLTMPDGTKFVFGGRHNYLPQGGVFVYDVPDACEMSSPRGMANDVNNLDLVFEINTWYLKTITDPNGNQITFSYIKKYPTTNKFYQVDTSSGIATNSGGNQSFKSGPEYNRYSLTEMMQWPVYLNKINSPNEIVNFSISTAVCNRYTQAQLKYRNYSVDAPSNSTALEGALLGSNCLFDPDVYLNNIQWQKLDLITVTDNPYSVGLYQNQPIVTNKFSFTYNNTATQRLRLGSFQKLDRNSTDIEKYQFYYNSDFVTQTPALHADGNYTDHWGTYNGVDLPLNFSSVPASRIPMPSVSTTELLNKIVYPTGGATVLVWESNDYSQIVSIDRQSLVTWSNGVFGDNTLTGFGGGNRIAEIKNTASDGTVLTHKKYIYKNNYAAGVNLSTLSSSGVLNGAPIYSFNFSNIPGYNGVYYFNGGSQYLYSNGNYGYTGQGSPVGYKEVTEVNLDGSYTRNLFTNYDADINGVSHWDRSAQGSLGWNSSSSIDYNYFPMATLEAERGKPIASFVCKPDNTILQKTLTTYRNDAGRFDMYINLIEKRNELNAPAQYYTNGVQMAPSDRIVFASARKLFTYSYYPISKTTTAYDQSGSNPIVTTENYTGYNASNLLTGKTVTNSAGHLITTSYQYPTNYATTPYTSMVNAHILNPLIKTTVVKTVPPSTQVPVSESVTNYSEPATGIFTPQNIQLKVGSNTAETREQINLYDTHGNPLEIQKPNGVKEAYIWGTNYSQILARVTGAGYAEAIALVDPYIINRAGFSDPAVNETVVRAELNKIRTGLPNALVTSYTYKIGLGITSETDPRGRNLFYDYDAYNRLALIRDHDNKVIKKFCYNYAGQTENCSLFGNQIQSSTLPRNNCATDYVGTNGTYTVPANTYFSAINVTEANNKALEDIAQNAQNYINNNPLSGATCNPAVKGSVSNGMGYTITFTNTATSAVTNMSLNPPASNVQIGSIAPGTYNITITPLSSMSAQITLNGNMQTGSTVTFSNVVVSTPVIISIIAPPAPCSYTMSSGFTSPTNSISSNGTTASGYITFSSSSIMTDAVAYTIATINGSCRPTATQTLPPMSAAGRTWTVKIYPSGQMTVQMASGSAQLSAGTNISLSGISYTL